MASLSSSARRLLGLILLALNVLLVNLLIARIAPSWDCTANAAFSVSDDTREILRHLEQRVTISVLMAPPERYTPSLYYHVKELLTRYQQLSKRIVVRAIDLDADPERALLEANALGVGPQLLRRGVVVVTSGQRRRQIPVDQLATRQHGRIVDSSADAAISAAIVAISERKRRQVCLTEGHGEPGVDDLGDGGLSRLAVAIENDNFVLKRLPPSALADLSPRRCSVLAVIGPTRELLAAESQRIAAFLERGGALLAMIGPVIDGDGRHFRPLPLKELLVRWGVRFHPGIVLDPQAVAGERPLLSWRTSTYATHPALVALGGRPTVWRMAQALAGDRGVEPLVMSSVDAFRVQSLDALRGEGQVIRPPARREQLAVAVAVARRQARIVVFGSERGVLNRRLDGRDGNLALTLGSLDWLSRRARGLSLRARQGDAVPRISVAQLRLVFSLSVIGVPALLLAVALWVWRRRRVER
ncbi:MAG: GldG family protein [Deltaproteobacteria bacterium]|nr:GldG family protein [Deltaproteobacteria bacterium]